MGYGQNPQLRCRLEVDHVIRKTGHGETSDRKVAGDSRHCGTGSREIEDTLDRGVDRVEELYAESGLPGVIPTAGFPIFGVSLGFEADGYVHGLRSAASARARTSSHAMP